MSHYKHRKREMKTKKKNQCCANINVSGEKEMKRCENEVTTSAYHCVEHYDGARKLYKKYKKICDVAYKMDINKSIKDIEDQRKYLHKCYGMFNKAYEARKKHREYSFSPECYDRGHNIQFEILSKKMKLCELKLYEIYKHYETNYKRNQNEKQRQDEEERTIRDKEKQEELTKNMSILFERSQFKQGEEKYNQIVKYIKRPKKKGYIWERKLGSDKEYDMWQDELEANIQRGIEEKNKKLIYKDIIVDKLVEKLYGMMEKYFEDELYVYIVMWHTLIRLYTIGYFDEDHEPTRCNKKECDCYTSHDIPKCCGCEYYCDDLWEYILLQDTETLKKIYELLLLYERKIVIIMKDLQIYSKLFDIHILALELELNWNEKKNRYEIEQTRHYKFEEKSKMLSRFRYKKHHFKHWETRQTLYESESETETETESEIETDSDIYTGLDYNGEFASESYSEEYDYDYDGK